LQATIDSHTCKHTEVSHSDTNDSKSETVEGKYHSSIDVYRKMLLLLSRFLTTSSDSVSSTSTDVVVVSSVTSTPTVCAVESSKISAAPLSEGPSSKHRYSNEST
jgi:hypothetical protein